jgi:hypothetical protein
LSTVGRGCEGSWRRYSGIILLMEEFDDVWIASNVEREGELEVGVFDTVDAVLAFCPASIHRRTRTYSENS